jgi:hypothetical protein
MTFITLQWVNLAVVTLDILLCAVVIRLYHGLAIWLIPIFLLLLSSAVFRTVLIVDMLAYGKVNASIYNTWSSVIHLQDKTTISVYALGLIFKGGAPRRWLFATLAKVEDWRRKHVKPSG